jgi:hypothetical protein
LPLGTEVEVTRLDERHQVRVRINDGLGKQTLSCFVLLLQLHITTP